MSGLDDLTKKISELLGDAAHATSNVFPQAWKLLVDYQKATALASIIGSVFGIISACVLYIFAIRLIKSAAASYKKAVEDKCRDPVERASVLIPGGSGIIIAIIGAFVMGNATETLPIAIAKHYYPESFAAQQLIETAVGKKPVEKKSE